jgi:hypothetical protein
MQCSKKLPYSITSSAIVRLSALAVLRFMLRVTLIAGSIGRSTGCAPFEDVLGHDLAEACTASLCL